MNIDFQFKNDCGEKFFFSHQGNDVWLFWGDETGYEKRYFYDFYGGGFMFSNDELDVIREHIEPKSLYPYSNYQAIFDGNEEWGTTSLFDVATKLKVCPVCFVTGYSNQEFENHHVLAAMDGGSDGKHNRLAICRNCHSQESFGRSDTSQTINKICVLHQMIYFPGTFYIFQGNNKRYKDGNMIYFMQKFEQVHKDAKEFYQWFIKEELGNNYNDFNNYIAEMTNHYHSRSIKDTFISHYHYMQAVNNNLFNPF